MSTASQRIKELGLVLPPAPPPAGLYKPVLVADKFLYVSGQGVHAHRWHLDRWARG